MHRYSRYRFCEIETSASGHRYLGERPKFTYRDLPDNRLHTCSTGQRLYHVAQLCFGRVARAGNLWWVIADFQPEPIQDPTIDLAEGRVLVVPSLRTLEELVFSQARQLKAAA